MCLTPIRIMRNKPNEYGHIAVGDTQPPLCDDGVPFYFVPCGKCVECLNNRRNDWYVRVRKQLECGSYKSVMWIRFSWDDQHIPTTREELSRCIHLWRDRMRKALGKGNKMDYFLITELGDHENHSGRLHIHGFLMFKKFVPYSLVRDVWHGMYIRKNGYAWTVDAERNVKGEYVLYKRIMYCMKYVFKGMLMRYKDENDLTARIFCSLGMGSAFLTSRSFRYQEGSNPHAFAMSLTFDGKHRYRYPRYWIEKIYKMIGYRHKNSCEMLFQSIFGKFIYQARGSASTLIDLVVDARDRVIQSGKSFCKVVVDYRSIIGWFNNWRPDILEQNNLVYDLISL